MQRGFVLGRARELPGTSWTFMFIAAFLRKKKSLHQESLTAGC